MLQDAIIAFGKVDAQGDMISGSDNWHSSKDDSWGVDGVYRIDLHNNPVESPTVIVTPGDHNTYGGAERGIKQSDNIFVPFDVSAQGFGVNSRDISGHNAGNEDCPFNFVVLGIY